MDGDGSSQDYPFAVYISGKREKGGKDSESTGDVEAALKTIGLTGARRWFETRAGWVVACALEKDADLLVSAPLSRLLASQAQAVKFTKYLSHKQILLIRDVPNAIPLQELRACMEQQGIIPTRMERLRQNIKIEIPDGPQCENLLKNGLDFYGVTKFSVASEGFRKMAADLLQDPLVQCYRCQEFWHIAAQCREAPRCVRCGGPHSVEACTVPRNQPLCCHCGGPHHAAYRHCPYRLHMSTFFSHPCQSLAVSR